MTRPFSVLNKDHFSLAEADPHAKNIDFNFFEVKEVTPCQTFYD